MPRERIKTFVRGFDEELRGGIPAGEVVLLRGPTGTMKSSLAFYILYNHALSGTPGLYITVEQSATTLLDQMTSLGLKTASIAQELIILDLSRGREHLEEFAQKIITGQQSKRDRGSTLTAVLKSKILELKNRMRFALLAIDSWDALEIILDFKERRIETFRLFEWLRDLESTSFLISEVDPVASTAGDFEEEFLADAIFDIEMEQVGQLDFQRRIQCVKIRSTNASNDFFTLTFENGRFEATRAIS